MPLALMCNLLHLFRLPSLYLCSSRPFFSQGSSRCATCFTFLPFSHAFPLPLTLTTPLQAREQQLCGLQGPTSRSPAATPRQAFLSSVASFIADTYAGEQGCNTLSTGRLSSDGEESLPQLLVLHGMQQSHPTRGQRGPVQHAASQAGTCVVEGGPQRLFVAACAKAPLLSCHTALMLSLSPPPALLLVDLPSC